MKALTLETYGGPEVVQLRLDVPKPPVTPGHVLIKVACAGINFMDVHTRQGKYAQSVTYPVRVPCTLGMEGAGVVVEVGEGVSHLAPGDRVAWCIAWGAFAEYASVPALRVAQIPNAIGFDQAAGIEPDGVPDCLGRSTTLGIVQQHVRTCRALGLGLCCDPRFELPDCFALCRELDMGIRGVNVFTARVAH